MRRALGELPLGDVGATATTATAAGAQHSWHDGCASACCKELECGEVLCDDGDELRTESSSSAPAHEELGRDTSGDEEAADGMNIFSALIDALASNVHKDRPSSAAKPRKDGDPYEISHDVDLIRQFWRRLSTDKENCIKPLADDQWRRVSYLRKSAHASVPAPLRTLSMLSTRHGSAAA